MVKNFSICDWRPYGFSDTVYSSTSPFADDFSHQMVRLFFIEQLYRGFILKNEPYHHQ
jgi:23S rRNA (pseudouridine1915-N3)-methyltransferase